MRKKNPGCKRLPWLLKVEMPLIKKHLARHKHFKHIADETEAQLSFIKDFGPLMKEILCMYACPDKDRCQHARDLRAGLIEKNPEEK